MVISFYCCSTLAGKMTNVMSEASGLSRYQM